MYLNTILTILNFRITEGSKYLWDSFGANAWRLDSFSDEVESSCIFDTQTQEVCVINLILNEKEPQSSQYKFKKGYQWINPKYRDAYIAEHEQKGFNYLTIFDDVLFEDILEIETFLSLFRTAKSMRQEAIIPLNIEDDLLISLSKIAHEKDITLNQLMSNIISEQINVLQNMTTEEAQAYMKKMSNDYGDPLYLSNKK